jgi:hypothetical protein
MAMAYHRQPAKEYLKDIWADSDTTDNDLVKITLEDGSYLYVRHAVRVGIENVEWKLDEALMPSNLQEHHRAHDNTRSVIVTECVTTKPLVLTFPTGYWRDNAIFTSNSKVATIRPVRRPRIPRPQRITGYMNAYRDAYP